MSERWAIAAFFAATAFVPLIANADSPPVRPTAPDATELVKQLGSTSFQTREAAERQLKAIGTAAIPALTVGAASKDVEIAERCKRIQGEIRLAEIEEFVNGTRELDSSAWNSFRSVLGDSPVSRRLFAEMVADETRATAMQKAEANPAQAFDAYSAAMDRAAQSAQIAYRKFTGVPLNDELKKTLKVAMSEAVSDPAEVATVLWLGRQPVPAGRKDVTGSRMLFGSGFAIGLEGPSKDLHRKLFAAWLERRTDPSALQAGMDAALHLALPEAVPVARRLLGDKSMPPLAVGKAILVIGHHGKADDVPLIAGFRNDERAIKTAYKAGAGQIGTTQVRDVAVAMTLKLSGQDFEKYGFASDKFINYQIRLEPAPFRSVAFFKSDDARWEAHKKAWQWLDAQPKKSTAESGR